jgi:hypothetical protein
MLYGLLVCGCYVAGLFFYRFWRRTRDRFFLFFALGFWGLGCNWLGLALTPVEDETRTYFYLLRLAGFGLILLAIVDKNKPVKRP